MVNSSVVKAEAEGLPRASGTDRRPTYDVRAVVQWWTARRAEQVGKRAPGGLDEREQRARYYEQKADALRRENAAKSGDLVDPIVIGRVLGKVTHQIAAALSALLRQLKVDIPHLRASEVNIIRDRLARCRNAMAHIQIERADLAQLT
jgi:phage terminase Nu1 subunit (DNA packaging protein)